MAAEPADDHAAHAAAVGELALSLDHGKRWATDTALRGGMATIKDAFLAQHDAYHDGKMTAAQATELADRVDAAVRDIIAKCKLAPEADAELHKVLAAALGAVNVLRSAEFGPGMPRLHEALLAYGQYFDHPGWD
ncbi:MAG: hypothetical protein IT494_08935 [Gammaproteobacteria bacterium]|nr:hypothetical protein [Gammaproteobacteria bacterium]